MLFASKTGMGLDVDDLSLELVAAQSSAKEVKRVAVSRVVLPVGVISNGVIKDEQKLAQAIRRLLAEAQPKAVKPGAVVFGVPHSQFYPALVELPLAETKALKESVWKLAQENLPVATEDLLLDYKVLSQKEEVAQVLMVGVSRAYLMSWQKFLAGLGFKVEAFDIAAYALWRDLQLNDRQQTVAVLDIGARKTNVFVFDRGQLNYSYDFEIGGHHLTKVLAEKLEIGREEAENKKVKQGLVAQLLPAWQEALYELAREVVVALTDYQSKTGLLVKEIKLVGGGAKLKGLVNYLEEKIPLPVSLGALESLQPGDDSLFIEAGGLALKAINPSQYETEPQLILRNTSDLAVAATSALKSKDLSESDDLINEAEIGSQTARFRLEKKLLLVIVGLGLIALAVAYWYRGSAKVERVQEQVEAVSFAEVQSFPYKLVISLAAEADQATSTEVVSGRVLDDQVKEGKDFDQVLLDSRERLLVTLTPDEELWPEPLNEVIDKSSLSYPLTLRWLAFNKTELLKLAVAGVDKLNVDKVPYEFNSISKTKLEKTDSLDRLYIYGDLVVSLNQKIAKDQVLDLSSLASASSTVAVVSSTLTKMEQVEASSTLATETEVVISNTETGWLNARSGPGRNFAVVVKLYPGEKYNWLAEDGEWWQLQLNDGQKVWILSKYARKSS